MTEIVIKHLAMYKTTPTYAVNLAKVNQGGFNISNWYISRNTKCDNLVGFAKSGHIQSYIYTIYYKK